LTPSWRSVPTYSLDNSLTWQRGTHSLAIGADYLLSSGWESAQQMVPAIDLGFNTQFDLAAGLFTTANFPSASGAQLTDARELYALLTGRVSSISAQIALDATTNQYALLGPRTRAGKIEVYSAFAQDTWRLSPTVTLTGDLRWDVQLPFNPTNDIMSRVTMEDICGISGMGSGGTYGKCNFLSPGAAGGVVPEFKQLTRGTLAYNTDWNNFAPTIAGNWRPNVQSGILRTILGDPEAGHHPGRLLGRLRAPRPEPVDRHVRRQPRQHADDQPHGHRREPAGAAGRAVAGTAEPARPALHTGFRPEPRIPDQGPDQPREQPERLCARREDRLGAHLERQRAAIDQP
jgi:hypothetical protein